MSHFDTVVPMASGVTYAPGQVGLGFVLGEAGAGVDLGRPGFLDVQEFTVHAWIRRASIDAVASDAGGTGWILTRGPGGFGFGIQADGKLRFGAMEGVEWVVSNLGVTDMEFHHVAVVRSGVTVTFVLDGVAAGGGTWPVVLAHGGPAALGRAASGGGGSFAGMLDEVAFVDRALSGAQVLAVFQAGTAGMCLPPVDVPNDIPAATERLVQGSNAAGHLTVTSDGFGVDGSLRLQSANSSYLSAVAITSGGLTNRAGGLVTIRRGTEGPRGINGAFQNEGTWDVQWPLTVTSPGENVVNRGILDINGSGSLSLRGVGMRFDLEGGSVVGGNAIDGLGVTVRFRGGSLSGTPWLAGSRLEMDPGNTNAGSFYLTGSGSELVGGIGAGQMVTIVGSSSGGHTTVAAPMGVRSSGTVRLSTFNSSYRSELAVGAGGFVNEVGGVFETLRGAEGPRFLTGPLDNRGTVRAGWPWTIQGNGLTHVNRGAIEVSPGMSLALRGAGSIYRQLGGSISAEGAFDMESMRFDYEAGSMTGTLYLAVVDLRMDPVGNDPVSLILAGSGSRLTGRLNPGQSVWLRGDGRVGHSTIVFGDDFENNGTVRMESATSSYTTSASMGGGSFRNGPEGTFLVRRGTEGARNLSLQLVNDGLFGVQWPVTLGRAGAVHVNRGTLSVASGVSLVVSGNGQEFHQESGLLELLGGLDLTGVVFSYEGGQITGVPYLDGVRLKLAEGSGPAEFNLTGSASRLEGNVQPGQILNIRGDGRGGHTTAVAARGFENRGTIRIGSFNSSYTSALSVPTGVLTNRPGGMVHIRRLTEGARTLSASVLNEGTVQVGWPLTLGMAGAVHVNRGTWLVEPGMTLTVAGGGQSFIQDGGVLDVQGFGNFTDLRFDYLGGAIRGQPYLEGVRLEIGPDAVAPMGVILGRNGSQLHGRIHPGQEVWVRGDGRSGHTVVSSPAGIEVAGVLRVESANSSYTSGVSVGGDGLRILPGGRLAIRRGAEGARPVGAVLENEGTVEVGWPMTLGSAGLVHRNRGNVEVQSGMTLSFPGAGQRFVQTGGTLGVNGFMVLDSDAFRYEGGLVSGLVRLNDSRLELPDSAGPGGQFLMRGSTVVTGRVPALVTVVSQGNGENGHTTTRLAGGLRVGGVLRVSSVNSSYTSQLVAEDGNLVIEPGGVLEVLQEAQGVRRVDAPVVNRGFMDFQWPTRIGRVGSGVISEGRIRLVRGMSLTLDGPLQLTRGRFDGSGTVVGAVTSEALVSPGDGIGQVRIEGTYRQGARGILEIELGNAASDQLVVTGGATLGGLVRVSLVPGFVPEVGRTFQVVSASLDGTRPRMELPVLPEGRAWRIDHASGILLRVVETPVAAPTGGIAGTVTGPGGVPLEGMPVLVTQGPWPRGLLAEYWSGTAPVGNPRTTQVEPTLNNNWGAASPPGITTEAFFSRWTGQLLASHSEEHRIYTVSDDGIRVWLGNQLLIDNWTTHAPTENSALVNLVAGQAYELRVEHFEGSGGATAILLWSSPSVPKQVIPETALVPSRPANLLVVEQRLVVTGADGKYELPVGPGRWVVDVGGTEARGFGMVTPVEVTVGDSWVTQDFALEASVEDRLPDLMVTVPAAPATGVAGQEITVEWTGSNRGEAAALKPWREVVLLGRQPSGFDAVEIGRFEVSEDLAAGAEQVRQLAVRLPSGISGPWYLFVRTDAGLAVDEGEGEINNLGAGRPIQLLIGDLIVESVTAPARLAWGDTVDVQWVVRNVGGSAVTAPWTDSVSFSPTSGGGVLLGDLTPARTTPLEPGESQTNSLRVTIPLNSQNAPGTFFFLVRADRTGVQAEANESNNLGVSGAVDFVRPAPADLVVVGSVVPADVPAGAPVEVRWTVRNEGLTRAVGPWRDVIALAPTAESPDRTVLLAVDETQPLEPGESRERSRQVLFPAGLAGTHAVFVTTDALDQVFEGGPATNNTRLHPDTLVIRAPDLTVRSVATTGGRFGEGFEATWEVVNRGNSAVTGGWLDRLVLVGADGERVVGQLAVSAGGVLAPGAVATQALVLTVPLDGQARAGDYRLRVSGDARGDVRESDEANNVAESGVFRLEFPPLADLVVPVVTAPATALPGGQVEVAWTVRNAGAAAVPAGLAVRIELLATEGTVLLASLRLDEGLAAGGQVGRVTPVRVPLTVAGPVRFRVAADALNELVESAEGNNVAETSAPTEVPRQLSLVLPVAAVPENLNPPRVRARLGRSGPVTEVLAVGLSASVAGELELPAQVEIPAGSGFAEFDITVLMDGRVDGTRTVSLTAAADGFNPGLATLEVLDADRAVLSLVAETNRVREGLTIPVVLSRSEAAQEPLEVALGASADGLILPATLTIPAGATQAVFALVSVDNDRLEPARSIQVRAAASGHVDGTLEVEVADDDDPGLSLEIQPGQVGEGDGPAAAQVTVRRVRGLDRPLRVRLATDNPARFSAPLEVVIPSGQASVGFAAGAVNNRDNDGPVTVRMTASVVDPVRGTVLAVSSPATVVVQDDDGAALRLSVGGGVAREGRDPAFTAVVTRNSSTGSPLTVQLAGSDPTEATVPLTVVIPAGQASATFPVTTLDDGTVDGNQRVTLTATAEGHAAASAVVTVTDGDLPDLAFAVVTAPATGVTGGDGVFRYRVVNQGFAPVAGSFVQRLFASRDAYLSADDVLIDETPFTGTLAAGEFFQRDLTRRLPREAGAWQVIAVADGNGSVAELLEENNRTLAAVVMEVQPAYSATVETDVSAAPGGTPVPMRGVARRPDGSAAANELVQVHVRVRGTERVLTVLADGQGRFETVFQPAAGEFGRYGIAAGHPGAAGPATQDTFELLGLRAEPGLQFTRIIPGVTNALEVSIVNPNERELTSLQFEPSAVDNLGILIDGPVRLAAGESAQVRVRVWSREERDAVGRFVVRATSGEGAYNTFAVDYTVELPQPRLVARPARLDVGMVRGRQETVEFEVANLGGAETGPMDVTLPDLPWLRVASALPLPGLAPGGTARVTLVLTPEETVALGLHDGRLAVGNDSGRVTVPFTIRHVSDALGDLEVPVHDENTYYGDRALVAGASVALRDVHDNRTVRSGVTGTNGIVFLAGLPEGTYQLEVSAPRHDTFLKTVTVQPGVVNRQVAFLRTQLVRYNWTVEEVDFEETATIRLETLFETTVPVPVVTIEPAAIDLSQVTGDEHTVELKITNSGLIAAQAVALRFEDGSTWQVSPLTTDLGAIPPRSSLTVPVTFVRIPESGGNGSGRLAGPAAGGSLDRCRAPSLGVGWELLCGQFGVAYWSPVFVYDPGLCPPPPLVIARDPLGFLDYIPHYPWVASDPGGRGGRGFPIDIGYGPRGFASYSGTNDCNCLTSGFVEKCVQAEAGFKADAAAAAEAALKAVLGPIRWLSVQGFEIKFSGSGKLCTCCEEVDGQGVTGLKAEGDVGGAVEAKLFAGPQLKIDVPKVNVPGVAGASAEFFVGAGVELAAGGSVKLNAKTECFLSDPEVFIEARVQLKTPIGLKGKGVVKGTSVATGQQVEYEGEAFGGLDLGAYATVSGYLVGGQGKPTLDGCLDPIVLKAEAKLTRTVNGVFESIGVSAQQQLTDQVCINGQSGGAVLAAFRRMGEGEAVSRILGFETPSALALGVTRNQEAADAVATETTGRGLSDVLVRHLGARRVRDSLPLGAPVFSQSFGSVAGADAARRSAAMERQVARAGRGALPAGAGDANGVCAQVKLEIEQQAVVTRKGIGTTLEIINESTDQALEDIGVSIQVYDRDGNVVNDRFLILPPELTRLQPMSQAPTNRLLLGGLALTLPPDSTGSARWLIVPKDTAAPEEETEYFVGGHLAYRLGAVTKTAELTPGMVRVYPNARLHLKYFHQRDVFADDPFTDPVEPSEPFVLGVMVENRGRGLAKNFSITSAQPRIVDNAKGLLIHFDIIATEVAGRALTPSLTATFGDIGPGAVGIGRWLLKSSIQGLFLDYEATLEHEDRFGERGASVFEGVEIHELIRQVEAGGSLADGRPDFLVNDEADADDLPDTLHLSDATTAPVSVVREAVVDGAPTAGDLEVAMTVRAPRGWVYVRVPDPSGGAWILHQVRRGDGTVLPAANAWVTDRTFVGGGKRPIPGHVLHLLDQDSTGDYTLVYRRDERLPDTTAPTSSVALLGPSNPVQIPVRWSGTDDASGAGIDSYDVFVSTDGGPFQRWLTGTRSQSAFYAGAAGREYAFYTVARDRAGNVEAPPSTPDATTRAVGNSAPLLEAVADVEVAEGGRVELGLRGSDLDLPGDTLRYELVAGPPGAAVDGTTGRFAWQTGELDGPGVAVVRVRVVDDGEPAASTEREFRVLVREVNQPVSLRSVPAVQTVDEGRLFQLTLEADDADLPRNSLRFSLLPGAPAGVSVDPATGRVTWTPAEVQGGLGHDIGIEVTDQGVPATTAQVRFRVEVAKANSAPRLLPLAGGVVWEGDMVERIAVAEDGDIPVQGVAFALGSGSASGATLDPITGRFAWVPGEEHASRTNHFTVVVTDDGVPALSAEQTFGIRVRPLRMGLNLPTRDAAGAVSFRFKRRVAGVHRLEGSVNLDSWVPLLEFPADRSVVPVVDRSSEDFPWRFFRVVEVP